MTIFYSIIGVVIFWLAVAAYEYKNKTEYWKEKYELEKRENEYLDSRIRSLQALNTMLNNNLCQKSVVSVDNDIIVAVKYAMKKAHPDNGGKQEDFIKFNNLYNSIR